MFSIIDIECLGEEYRARLDKYCFTERVDLVYMWLTGFVVKNIKNGLLNVPPPILSRVFQELEKAMIEYSQLVEVMKIPFPFPYAQTAYFLLVLMGFGTPFAMCSWTNHLASCGILTFVAVVCLASLELIAEQLENPFGDDPNDLPVESFQREMNESLAMMRSPDALDSPGYDFAKATRPVRNG